MKPIDDREAEERRLREFFRAVHADDRAPGFERLARPDARPRWVAAWRPALAVAAAVVLTIALAWWLPRPGGPAGALDEEQQLALARQLSSWRGPLDFLLETPGREVLSSPPSLELSTLTMPPLPAAREEAQP